MSTPSRSVHVRREARVPGEFDGWVQGLEARGDRGLSLARLEAHVGLVACAKRNAVVCASRNGGLGDREDGAPLCALSRGASRRLCRQLENPWHNPGTVAGAAKSALNVTSRRIRDLLVAREGIEPPTRGFSVQRRIGSKRLIYESYIGPIMEYFEQIRTDKYLICTDIG